MSEISGRAGPGHRRLRADAERSRTSIIDAAITVLGRRPDAGMEEVAAVAGVSRQTVYAHYASRTALLTAVADRITAETAASLRAIDPHAGTALDALHEWLTVSWSVIDRFPVPLAVSLPADDRDRHAPIIDSLIAILHRGQESGAFTTGLTPDWLATATISLGHAAGQEAATGRMTAQQAGAAFRASVLRLTRV